MPESSSIDSGGAAAVIRSKLETNEQSFGGRLSC
jgi:hypothetical protein